MPTLLLIHGGLGGGKGADWFWRQPGASPDFSGSGSPWSHRTSSPASSFGAADAEQVLAAVPGGEPVTVVGGSFGCSVAVRLALDSPDRVSRMVLVWPASLGDQFVAIRMRASLARLGAAGPGP